MEPYCYVVPLRNRTVMPFLYGTVLLLDLCVVGLLFVMTVLFTIYRKCLLFIVIYCLLLLVVHFIELSSVCIVRVYGVEGQGHSDPI